MKKLFTLMILLACALGMNAASYPIWVAGTQVTDDNKSNILGDGKVAYNSSKNWLTLNNAAITSSKEGVPAINVGNGTDAFSLEIILLGSNTISTNCHGINVTKNATCSIESVYSDNYEGDLTINNSVNGYYAIQVYSSALSISHAKITAITGSGICGRSDGMAKSINITSSELHIKNVGNGKGAIANAQNISISGSTVTPSGSAFNSSLNAWASGGTRCSEVTISPVVYDVKVAGKQVTSRNSNSIMGSGKVKYDDSSKTLTLNNAEIKGTGVPGIEANTSLKIYLKGSNTVSSTNKQGIYFKPSGTHEICCDATGGTLASSTGGSGFQGILFNGTLTIKDCYVSATGYYGICGGVKENLKLDNAAVDMNATYKAMSNIGSLSYSGCFMSSPSNGYYSSADKEIYADGAVAKKVSVVRGTDNIKPVVPNKTISLSSITDNSVVVSWNPAQDNTTEVSNLLYRVLYQQKGASAWIAVPYAYEKAMSSKSLTNLKSGVTYIVTVGVKDEAGEYAYYNEAEFTTTTTTYSEIKVADKEVNSGNCDDILGDGTVSYDRANKKLVLNKANITATTNGIYYVGSGELTIYVQNASKISSGKNGIYLNGPAKITGNTANDYSLNITSTYDGTNGYSPIMVNSGKLTLREILLTTNAKYLGISVSSANTTGIIDINDSELTLNTSDPKTFAGAIQGFKNIYLSEATIKAPSAMVFYSTRGMNFYLSKGMADTEVTSGTDHAIFCDSSSDTQPLTFTGQDATFSGKVCGIMSGHPVKFKDADVTIAGRENGIMGQGSGGIELTVDNSYVTIDTYTITSITNSNPRGAVVYVNSLILNNAKMDADAVYSAGKGIVQKKNTNMFADHVEFTPDASGVNAITVENDDDAPAYDLRGIQVGKNYKGVVIKNGQKYIQK